jgi:protein SCO1/2
MKVSYRRCSSSVEFSSFRLRRPLASVLCALLLSAVAVQASKALSDDALLQIRFDQNLHTNISLNLPFVDEQGASVRLGQFFRNKPVILVLGYYQCPMLCSLVMNGMVESAEDLKWSIGRDYEVIDVSIDPAETPALAAAKKRTYLKRYGRSGAADGWHFLTGDAHAIAQLAHEVGFRYVYDPVSKQYAHPSGLVILTPQGRISRYLFGVAFSSNDLYAALRDASSNQVSSPIQQFILLCFHYNPITGRYSATILDILRLLSVATLLGIVVLVVYMSRRHRAASTVFFAPSTAVEADSNEPSRFANHASRVANPPP